METTSNETTQRFGSPSAGSLRQVIGKDSASTTEELLAVLLHDLRSPLGAVGVLADLLGAASRDGKVPEPRQILLLQEAVIKAQRIIDDAVEIQSLLRGSSPFTPVEIDAGTIVRNSLEKAQHAPYFRNVQLEYESENGDKAVKVDLEKAETAVLCALEESVPHSDRPAQVKVYYTVQNPFLNVHIVNERASLQDPPIFDRRSGTSLRGKLGNRRLGESRFNLELCSRVMALMGGKLEYSVGEFGRIIVLQLPLSR